MKKIKLKVTGMKCDGCEGIIEDNLNAVKGVTVKANYKNNEVDVDYDENKIKLEEIKKQLKKIGYNVKEEKVSANGTANANADKYGSTDYLKIIFIVFGVNMILNMLLGINLIGTIINILNALVSNVPTVSENTSLLVLFLIGGLTSFHCVAMCGGINLSQCIAFEKKGKFSPNLQYNLGRVVSYTLVGGIVGAIGSVLSISTSSTGYLYVIIGFFMVMMGLNLFGVPIVKKFIPRLPRSLRNINKSEKGPFIVGLLNGLMPCGPLQSMQLYALSTGSFVNGAISMFVFSVGTVPLMYLFGKIGDVKNKQFMNGFMKASAILVLFLGITMTSRGAALLGINFTTSTNQNAVTATVQNNVQVINYDLQPRKYPDIVVKKGVPVKLVINATNQTLNGCNNEIIIQEYGIQQGLKMGENVIEFTPTETGTYRYSCWMGMIRATITVVD